MKEGHVPSFIKYLTLANRLLKNLNLETNGKRQIFIQGDTEHTHTHIYINRVINIRELINLMNNSYR